MVQKLDRRLAAMVKGRQALALKLEGKTDEEIAKACGWKNVSSVYATIAQTLKAVPAPEAETYRRIHLERLELLWRGLFPMAKFGDPQSVRAAVLVLRRQAALLGLDAPVRIDVRAIVAHYAQEYGLDSVESDHLFHAIKDHLADARGLPAGGEAPETAPWGKEE